MASKWKGVAVTSLDQLKDVNDQTRYQARLATLVRIKRKVKVPPRRENKAFSYEKAIEARFPKNRGQRLDPDHPPDHPYTTCDPEC